MASMTVSGQGANVTVKNWKRTMLKALYDKMRLIPHCDMTAEALMGGLYVRRMGKVTAQQLATSQDGTTFNIDSAYPVATVITPQWILAATGYSDQVTRQVGTEIKQGSADTCNGALAAGCDNYISQLVASATYNSGGAGYSVEPVQLRAALQSIAVNSSQNAEEGELWAILSATQIAASLNVPEITQAIYRGDGTAPVVTGRLSNGYGFKFDYSTILYADAAGYHCPILKPDAISYGWNKQPDGEVQRYLKQVRVMADAEIGGAIIYPEMIVDMRTS